MVAACWMVATWAGGLLGLDMISFGPIFLELVFGHVHTLPGPGEEVFTDDFAVSCGGAVTSAGAAAAAGVQAGLCTVLGDDLGAAVVQEYCRGQGVDLSPSLRVRRRAAGITVVLNFDGDRAFVSHKPPVPATEPADIDRWRSVLQRSRPPWCYLHGGQGVPDLLRDARQQGTRTVLDVSLGDERNRDLVIECVRLADLFVPNEVELQRLTRTTDTGAAVSAAMAWGTPMVVKRGAAGALVVSPDGASGGSGARGARGVSGLSGLSGVTEVSAGVRRVEVRDLTGAGDAFAGAMIGALVRGAPLITAVAAANAAGSEAVSRLGAVGEVEVAGFSSAGYALDAMFAENVAVVLQAQTAVSQAAQQNAEMEKAEEMEKADMEPEKAEMEPEQ